MKLIPTYPDKCHKFFWMKDAINVAMIKVTKIMENALKQNQDSVVLEQAYILLYLWQSYQIIGSTSTTLTLQTEPNKSIS